MTACYAIFHMNLNFSAIAVSDRDQVIASCYHPMLDLAESGIPIGIECNAWTLEEIARRDDRWVQRFRDLLQQGACELISGGYIQLIGPLAPRAVSARNQEIGLTVYQELLGVRPDLVMIGEMAFSHGHLAVYPELGYRGLVVERDNIQLVSHGMVPAGMRLAGTGSPGLPVLWADTILFQKFQRLIYGDIDEAEYNHYLSHCLEKGEPLAVYCSDAEIFDFRPKRYHYEQDSKTREWEKISSLLSTPSLKSKLVLPGAVLKDCEESAYAFHSDIRAPILVKKQPKYNVARWAVTGRDDLHLNTLCHRLTQTMTEGDSVDNWKRLCRMWSSDLRTHIHPDRFREAWDELGRFLEERDLSRDSKPMPGGKVVQSGELEAVGVTIRRSRLFLELETPHMALCLNLRRGLTIRRLAFDAHDFRPCVGTLEQGFFEAIDLGADFYSGGVVIELPGQLKRITDLEWVEPAFLIDDHMLRIRAELETDAGKLIKILSFSLTEPSLELRYDFPDWERPFGTVRLGNITLRPEAFDLSGFLALRVNNGGETERFEMDKDCNHGEAVSSLISCTTGFGGTTGRILMDCNSGTCLELSWDPSVCAAFPMLVHRYAEPWQFTRITFSLAELDDTRKSGGKLLPFEFKLRPASTSEP